MSPASDPRHVVVIGAGMAGLAAAIDLAAAGVRVTLCEACDGAGGKVSETVVAGRPIDRGPTVLTMLPVFARLFADAGASFGDAVRATPAATLARHAWSGGARLDLFADPRRSEDAVGMFAGAREARGYRAFAAAARRIHDALHDSFMTATKPSGPLALMWRGGWRGLPGFLALDPYRSLSRMAASHFSDPRLVQLFGRYATYCGSSPYRAPATLALVADVEARGVWLVDGGIARVADAMAALFLRLGGTLRLGCRVASVRVDGRARGVVLDHGERIDGDAVLLAADAAALAAGCFGAAAAAGARRFGPGDRSYSAFTVAAVGRARFDLARHTVFFSDDPRAEFGALDAGRMPADPTVYVCAQDRDADGRGASGEAERLFLVLNAPADGDRHGYDHAETERWMGAALTRLRRSGLTLSPEACSTSTPSDFERRFPATGGALYGRASHGWTASFRRPGARTAIPGLWLAGGSVHPGAGVPMAALSGRIAAASILAGRARASTWRSPRAAMPGGTSTPSPTTAATA